MKMFNVIRIKAVVDRMSQKELPIILAYKLGKIIGILSKEAEYYEDLRVKLVKQYGDTDKDGNISVLPENFDKWSNEHNTLLEYDVDLTLPKISLAELEKAGITISPADMAILIETDFIIGDMVTDRDESIVDTLSQVADKLSSEA